MLTKDQIKQNIEALEKQGASQGEIQGWLDSLKGSSGTNTPPAPKAPTPTAAQNAQNFLTEATPGFVKPIAAAGAGILGAMTSNIRKFGTTLGNAAAAVTGATDQINESAMAESDSRTTLAKLLNDPGVSEEQKAHIRAQLGQGTDVGTSGEQIDLKSTKEIIGEGLGTAAEVASLLTMGKLKGGKFGSTGKELSTAVAETLPRSFATKFPKVARYLGYAGTGALFGGTAAAGRSLQDESGMKELARDTAWGATIGALTNVAIPAVLEGSAALYRKAYETFSGVPKEAVDKLIDDPSGMLSKLRSAAKDPAQAQSDILQSFDDGVNVVRGSRAQAYEASLAEAADRTVVSKVDPNMVDAAPIGEGEKSAMAEKFTRLAEEAEESLSAFQKKFVVQGEPGQWKGATWMRGTPEDYFPTIDSYREQAAKFREAAELVATDPSKASALDPDAAVWWKGDDGVWTETSLSPSSVKGNFTKLLNDFKFRRSGGIWNIGQADLPASYLPKINEINARIQTWDDFTPLGFNQLRRVISSYDDGSNPAFSRIIGKLAEQTDNYVNNNAPDVIRNMNSDYAKASKFLDQLKREIGSTEGNQQMKVNRIIGIFKPNSVYRKELIEQLGKKEADELLGQASAYLLSQIGPQGTLRRVIEGMGAAGLTTLGIAGGASSSLWALAPAAALSSPRAGAEITAAALPAARGLFDIAKRVGPAVSQLTGGQAGK